MVGKITELYEPSHEDLVGCLEDAEKVLNRNASVLDHYMLSLSPLFRCWLLSLWPVVVCRLFIS